METGSPYKVRQMYKTSFHTPGSVAKGSGTVTRQDCVDVSTCPELLDIEGARAKGPHLWDRSGPKDIYQPTWRRCRRQASCWGWFAARLPSDRPAGLWAQSRINQVLGLGSPPSCRDPHLGMGTNRGPTHWAFAEESCPATHSTPESPSEKPRQRKWGTVTLLHIKKPSTLQKTITISRSRLRRNLSSVNWSMSG